MTVETPIEISINLLAEAAGMLNPWRIVKWRIDKTTKTINIWVTKVAPVKVVEIDTSWFGLRKVKTQKLSEPASSRPDQMWKHIDTTNYAFFIHTTDQLTPSDHLLPWLGQTGLPFTNQLSRKIFICLMEGLDFAVICDVFRLSFADLWRFKHALDNGSVKFEYTSINKSVVKNNAAKTNISSSSGQQPSAAQKSDLGISSQVPSIDDPIWEGLVLGTVNMEIKALSFQLILTKLRQQVRLQNFNEVKILKMRELHRYVERNEKNLAFELRQLNLRNASVRGQL